MRNLWKAGLVIAPLAAMAVILLAVVTHLVPDPPQAMLRRLARVSEAWPFSYFPPGDSWWIVWLALGGTVALYTTLRLLEAHRERRRPLDGEVPATFDTPRGNVSASAARVFVGAMLQPHDRFARITESVEPYTRSLNVKTTLAVRAADMPVGHRLIIPVILSERGRLENRLSFTDEHGTRISSLNRTATNAFIHGAVRLLIRRSGPIVWTSFHRPRSGGSIDARVRSYVSQVSAHGNEPVSEIVAMALMEDLLSLPRTPFDSGVLDVAALLWELRLDYPICVAVSRSSSTVRLIRVTVQRRVIPAVQSSHAGEKERAGMVARNIRRLGRAKYAVGRWAASALDWLRQAAGVTSSVISHDLGNAARAESYHLEIAGLAGYYAARQQIVDDLGIPISDQASIGAASVQHSALRGQRHTHLYLRSAAAARGSSFRAVFHERTPGSMAPAVAAAFSAMVVTLILAINQTRSAAAACEKGLSPRAADYASALHDCMTTTAASTGSSDTLLQILLTFPIAILAMPMIRNSSVWGGVLVARVANVTTVALVLGALMLSNLSSAFTPAGLSIAWIVITGAMLTALTAGFVSWAQRVLVHISYIRSRTN